MSILDMIAKGGSSRSPMAVTDRARQGISDQMAQQQHGQMTQIRDQQIQSTQATMDQQQKVAQIRQQMAEAKDPAELKRHARRLEVMYPKEADEYQKAIKGRTTNELNALKMQNQIFGQGLSAVQQIKDPGQRQAAWMTLKQRAADSNVDVSQIPDSYIEAVNKGVVQKYDTMFKASDYYLDRETKRLQQKLIKSQIARNNTVSSGQAKEKTGRNVAVPYKGSFITLAGKVASDGTPMVQYEKGGKFVPAPAGSKFVNLSVQGSNSEVHGTLDKITKRKITEGLIAKRGGVKLIDSLINAVEKSPNTVGIVGKIRETAGGAVGILYPKLGEVIDGKSSTVLTKARTIGGMIARDIVNAGAGGRISDQDLEAAKRMQAVFRDSTNARQVLIALREIKRIYDLGIKSDEMLLAAGKVEIPTNPDTEELTDTSKKQESARDRLNRHMQKHGEL